MGEKPNLGLLGREWLPGPFFERVFMEKALNKSLNSLEKLFRKRKALTKKEKDHGRQMLMDIRVITNIYQQEYNNLNTLRTVIGESPEIPDKLWK